IAIACSSFHLIPESTGRAEIPISGENFTPTTRPARPCAPIPGHFTRHRHCPSDWRSLEVMCRLTRTVKHVALVGGLCFTAGAVIWGRDSSHLMTGAVTPYTVQPG